MASIIHEWPKTPCHPTPIAGDLAAPEEKRHEKLKMAAVEQLSELKRRIA